MKKAIKKPIERNNAIRVLLRQPALPHYRLAIFKNLAKRRGINLHLAFDVAKNMSNVEPVGFDAEILRARKLVLPKIGKISVDFALNSRILEFKPHVVVLSWNIRELGLWFILAVLHRKRIGTVVWGHGYSKNDSKIRIKMRNILAKKADAVLCYNKLIAENLSSYGVESNSIFVAQNALDQTENLAIARHYTKFPNVAKKIAHEHGIIESKTWLISVSRLDKANNFGLLVRAVAQLESVGLIIIGSGDSQIMELTALANDLGVSESVIFTGAIYDAKVVGALLHSATLFCYPSNMGLSLHHAFAFGLPVITGNDSSLHGPEFEAIKDGVNGALFSHNNLEAFCELVGRLLDNPQKLEQMSKVAKKTIEVEYTADTMVDGMVSAIQYARSKYV